MAGPGTHNTPQHAAPEPGAPASAPQRFDPPPPGAGPQQIENVISEVEQLTHGIDAILRGASNSAIGGSAGIDPSEHAAASRASDSGDAIGNGDVLARIRPGQDGDDPVMRIFDEDEPSDIHEIDRMLSAAAPALEDVSDTLEGDFHGVEDILESQRSASADGNPATATPARADHSAAPAPSSAPSPNTPNASIAAPLDVVAAGAVPTVVSAAPLTPSASVPAARPESVDVRATLLNLPGAAAPAAAAPAEPVRPGPAAQSSEPAAPVATTAAPAPKPRVRSPKGRRGPGWAVIGKVANVIALSNLPLRMVPPSLRPAVNALALSLVLWGGLLYWAGPQLGARLASARASAAVHHEPSHQQSGIKADKPKHGEAKAASHGH